MTAQKHIAALGESEVHTLKTIMRKGIQSARVMTRARVLLMANDTQGMGKTDRIIADALGLAKTTPQDIRRRFALGGLPRALYDAPRPGQKKKATGRGEAAIVSIACTDPPDGHDRWTMNLITEKANGELKKKLGRTTVYRVLLKHETKPWREKNLVHKDKR